MNESMSDAPFLMTQAAKSVIVPTSAITRPLHNMQTSDMVPSHLEVINDNIRQARVKFTSKSNFSKQRRLNFLPQE